MGIYQWSTTAGDNDDAATDINWAEGQAPSTVNDSARELMADVAEWLRDISCSITTGGTTSALTLTTNGAIDSNRDGILLGFIAGTAANSGATLNVDSQGAKALLRADGASLASGDVVADGAYLVVYDASADGGSGAWLVLNPSSSQDTSDVKAYGAKGDGRIVSDGVATASDATVTSATAAFTDSDVGKVIAISGAGIGGAWHYSTIDSVNSATSVELASAPATSGAALTIVVGTDDTSAINSAFAAMRDSSETWLGWQTVSAKVSFSPGIYIVTGAINATNIKGRSTHIHGNGAHIVGFTNGQPVFDMCDTRFVHMRDFFISSTDVRTPSWAILHGRGDSGNVADNMTFENVVCAGDFTGGCLINVAAETCLYKSCRFSNFRDGSPTAVLDASNVTGATSTHDTLVTSGSSMNSLHFIHCYFDTFTGGTGAAIEIRGDVTGGQAEEVRDILFDGCYGNTRYDGDTNTGASGEETSSFIYCDTNVQNLEWKGRIERTHYVKHLIEFDNTGGNLRCDGLVLREHYLASTYGAVGCTKAQGAGSAGFVLITNGDIRVPADSQVSGAPLFGGRTNADGTGSDITDTIQYWGTIRIGRDSDQADLSMLHTFNGMIVGRVPRTSLTMPANGAAIWMNQTNVLELKGTVQTQMSGALGKVVLSDNESTSFTPAYPKGAVTIAVSNDGVVHAYYDTNVPEVVVVWYTDISPVDVSTTTGALTGTTGTNGDINISAHTDGKIYIENRRGSTRTLTVSVSC